MRNVNRVPYGVFGGYSHDGVDKAVKNLVSKPLTQNPGYMVIMSPLVRGGRGDVISGTFFGTQIFGTVPVHVEVSIQALSARNLKKCSMKPFQICHSNFLIRF